MDEEIGYGPSRVYPICLIVARILLSIVGYEVDFQTLNPALLIEERRQLQNIDFVVIPCNTEIRMSDPQPIVAIASRIIVMCLCLNLVVNYPFQATGQFLYS